MIKELRLHEQTEEGALLTRAELATHISRLQGVIQPLALGLRLEAGMH
jgi:hypothetical protein